MKYSEVFHVGACDIDINGYLRADAVLRFMQEIAGCQHEVFGPHIDDLRQDGKAFVLSRVSLDIQEVKGLSGKKVRVITWLKALRGYIFERNTVITVEGEKGEEVARATALWGLIDLSERRPLRASSITPGFLPLDEACEVKSPSRVTIDPKLNLEKLCSHRVSFCDCDENRHLNNTRYAEFFRDAIPALENARVSGISISYLNEARLGDEFDIYGSSLSNDDSCQDGECRYCFKTLLSNGSVGAEAIISLQRL